MSSPAISGLDLSEHSRLHRDLVQAIRRRFELSARQMEQRYDRWNDADAMLRGFVDFRKQASNDPTRNEGKESPFARSIVIPLTYLVQQTYLTYLMAVFASREPQFAVVGRGPEDVNAAEAMEHLLQYQMDRQSGTLSLYALFQDALRYGMGCTKVIWDREETTITRRVPVPFPMSLLMGQERVETQRVVGYEGNVLIPVDPFECFPDPRTPMGAWEHLEYLGHRVRRPYHKVMSKARQGVYDEEQVRRIPTRFNVDGLDVGLVGTAGKSRRDEFLKASPPVSEPADSFDRGQVLLEELSIVLVPNEWGLGPVTDPQVWILTLANREVVIRAQTSPYEHGKLPYACASFGFDPHSLFTQSLPELMSGLQTEFNWLHNSRMENVRKGLNIEGICDPSMVEVADLENPWPGKWVRIHPDYYGVPGAVERATKQLQFIDVTTGHLRDQQYLLDLIQRVTAATDPQSGTQTETVRTATEVSQVLVQSGRRLQLVASLLGAQAVRPMGRLMLQNTQQLLTQPVWVRLLGSASAQLLSQSTQDLIQVDPQAIQGQMDLSVQDGAASPDPASLAQTWKELFVGLSANAPFQQALAQQGLRMKWVDLFQRTVEAMGIKNVRDFIERIPAPTVMPDQAVAQQVQAGNLAPVGAGGNGLPAGTVTPVGMTVSAAGGNGRP